jgi:hypothetical protein
VGGSVGDARATYVKNFMTDPTTSNKDAVTADEILSVLKNSGVAAVETLIVADVPILGVPVIKQLWELFFSWIATYFIKVAQTGTTFAIIDVQVATETMGISAALAQVVAAEKTGDAAQIQAAIQNYANAQSMLTHDDGSAAPTG